MNRSRSLLLAAPLLAVPPLLAGCGSGVSAASQSADAVSAGPPASARMICNDDIRGKVEQALDLQAPPRTSDQWADGVYTCHYTLPMGPMTLSVRVLSGDGAASARLTADQARNTAAQPLAGLGERAFGTPDGTAVVLKDNQILTVDATALPAVFGANGQQRADFAYEVASDVLGCWTGGE